MRWFQRRSELDCQHAVELITDYLEHALPADQQRRLEAHLAGCPNCSQYLTQIQATITAVGRIEATELSPDARADLIELYRRTIG